MFSSTSSITSWVRSDKAILKSRKSSAQTETIFYIHRLASHSCTGCIFTFSSAFVHEEQTVDQTSEECDEEDWNYLIINLGLSLIVTPLIREHLKKVRDSEGITNANKEKDALCYE